LGHLDGFEQNVLSTLYRLEIANWMYNLYCLEGRRVQGRIIRLCKRNPALRAALYEVEIQYEYESQNVSSTDDSSPFGVALASVREEGGVDCFATDIVEVRVDHTRLFSTDGVHRLHRPLFISEANNNLSDIGHYGAG
jgi:hypothetical protein